jgi:hypothetical protein
VLFTPLLMGILPPLLPAMPGSGLGRVKTKSDFIVMPSGRQILRFFALRITTSLKIIGVVIPRRVFTHPGSIGWITALQHWQPVQLH